MTGHDKPLTAGARAAPIGAAPLTYAANDLRVFVSALERLGYRRELLLKAGGLSRELWDDPDARVPCDRFGAVIGCAMQQHPMKNLGIRMAAETPLGSFPLLDYLILTAGTVGEGIRQLTRYFRLVGAPTAFDIHEDEDPIVVMISVADNVLAVEFSLALAVLHFRRESESRYDPEFVAFAHRLDDAAEVEKILECEVRSPAPWSGWALKRSAWKLPLRRRDALLRGLLERQADEIIARIPTTDGVAFDVRRVLTKRIPSGDMTIHSVARELATSPRTLQRRLATAGFSFQDVVEQTRQEIAEKYLTDVSLSIAEVSYLLGYSEPSALHRAFKRWRGITPQAFRETQRARKL